MGIKEQNKLYEHNQSWEANSNMAIQKNSLSLQIIDTGSSLPYHIEHVYRTKTQILHLNSNQIFFIYNQVSLHVDCI
jgi:hypothetical protein